MNEIKIPSNICSLSKNELKRIKNNLIEYNKKNKKN